MAPWRAAGGIDQWFPKTELALQLQYGEPRRPRRDQVCRPKPQMQRRVRPVQNSAGGHRRLPMTGCTLPNDPSPSDPPGAPAPAAWASETLRPARREQVLGAGPLVGERPLELHDRPWEAGPRHLPTLPEPTG